MTSKAQLAALAAAHRLAFVPRTAATARELTRLLPAPHSTGVETGVKASREEIAQLPKGTIDTATHGLAGLAVREP